ncbi:MAG: crotonase/enoyl-CoA hydratase family protein [Acidimicrobiales bacterium]
MSESDLVTYSCRDGIALVTMDDGRVNVMTAPMIARLAGAFRQAEADAAVMVLTGRADVFSAGYDMAMFDEPIETIAATLQAGGELIAQMLAHPYPVVAACTGHAIAQGAFTLLACDVRIGVTGNGKIGLNEVAIGLTIPHYGVELARHQLSSAWFDHAALTGTLYEPEQARSAGFFHELVEASRLDAAALDHAYRLRNIDMAAHARTKERVRKPALDAIRAGLAHEFVAVR